MVERTLELTFRMKENRECEVDVYEPQSGECTTIPFPFSPDEHPEFDEALGNEIYSWLLSWMEELSDSVE